MGVWILLILLALVVGFSVGVWSVRVADDKKQQKGKKITKTVIGNEVPFDLTLNAEDKGWIITTIERSWGSQPNIYIQMEPKELVEKRFLLF